MSLDAFPERYVKLLLFAVDICIIWLKGFQPATL